MTLTHLSFHLVICEYFVYSPCFDENATKRQSETSREKPSINLKNIEDVFKVKSMEIQQIGENRFKGILIKFNRLPKLQFSTGEMILGILLLTISQKGLEGVYGKRRHKTEESSCTKTSTLR